MKKFRGYITEMVDELDAEFLSRALTRTSFNLMAKDFESLKHKKEIQHLFHLNFFPKLDMSKMLDSVSENGLSKAISMVRKESGPKFEALYKYNIKGVGPGEVMLYFLLNNAHLGGGSSKGLDLVDKSGNFEVKAVDYSPSGKYVNNFKVGGTVALADIMRGVIDLKKKVGGSASSEVNNSDLIDIEKKFPNELKKYKDMYVDRTYNEYFKNHKIIFLSNKKGGGYQLGDLIAIKQVKKSDIMFERITSGTIKPRVKI